MKRTVIVVFDGEVLRPKEPLHLVRDEEYQITIEDATPESPEEPGPKPLAKFLKYTIDTGIPDFAEQHDHYLYGTPKR